MPRIAILESCSTRAALLGQPMALAGHELHYAAAQPDVEEIVRFRPQIIVAGVYRSSSFTSWLGRDEDARFPGLGGVGGLLALDRRGVLRSAAVVLVAYGLEERELQGRLRYELFLECHVEPGLGLPIAAEICLMRADELAGLFPPVPLPPEGSERLTGLVLRWGSLPRR